MMRSLVLALGLAALLATGCGPIQASSSLRRAEEALREAHLRGWDKDCPYEVAAAEGYVGAARDLVGRSEFQAAREFADKAATLAASTREIAPVNARSRQSREKPVPPPAARPNGLPAPSSAPGGAR